MLGILQSIISGVLSPFFGWLNNKDNVTLGEFTAYSETERAVLVQWLQTQAELQASKTAMNSWWGAHMLVLAFGVPVALHWGAVFLDSTFKFHWGVPSLPGAYGNGETDIVMSFFAYTAAMPLVSGITQFLRK